MSDGDRSADAVAGMETWGMTLTEFLLARIAEDEAVARAADPLVTGLRVTTWTCDKYGHVAVDPARVLADVEAKRRIVELHTGDHECVGIKYGRHDTVYVHPDYASADDPTLCLLAAVYVDHPDFNDSWRA